MLKNGEIIQGKYRVKNVLGEGGMNRVFLVEDRTGRVYAMKVTRDPGEVQSSPGEIFRQFFREIKILATLEHPMLPEVIDYFSIESCFYVVEEYIAGVSLEKYISKHSLNIRGILDLAVSLCDALNYLHRNNVIFRDLKPANIMILQDRKLKLVDFDIARYYKKSQVADTVALGTPGYAAPETYGHSQSDARSDIYSLGATMHHLLTGIDPQNNPFHFDPVNIHRPAVSPGLQRIVEKTLDPNPDKRFKSARALRKALDAEGRKAQGGILGPADFFVAAADFSLEVYEGLMLVKEVIEKSNEAAELEFVARIGTSRFLLDAARENDEERVKFLLSQGLSTNLVDEDQRSALHWAVINENLDMAENLINHGAAVNSADKSGKTPLDWAIFRGNRPLQELLITRGANVDITDKYGKTTLHNAVMKDDRDFIKLILKGKVRINAQDRGGRTPLHLAAKKGIPQLAEILLIHRADTSVMDQNGLTPMHCVRNRETAIALSRYGASVTAMTAEGVTPLYCAVERNESSLCDYLVEKGADKNAQKYADGRTPLHIAIERRYAEIADMLVRKGANVNMRDAAGNTPLHCAVKGGEPGVARLLVENGAEMSQRNNEGETPIHLAIEYRNSSIMELFIENGADINQIDRQGNTPLFHAYNRGAWNIVELLVERGADLNLSNRNGNTLLLTAVKKDDIECARLLVEKGADVNCRDRNQDTPLHIAARHNNAEIVRMLAEKDVDLYAKGKSGIIPLDSATSIEMDETLFRIAAEKSKQSQPGMPGQM